MGMDRFEVRQKLWADMRAEGLVVGEKAHVHQVGHCERCGTVVEPLLSTQWFVKMKPLAQPAIEAVRDGRIKIVPERFEKIYFQWMENIRDWCISRQLWWGHRIPVWYGPDGKQFAARNESEALEKAIEYYGDAVELEQDEDVLDTWFSSGLWPFSTLGWPQQTEDLARFYPTSVLETGYDILFFWVARMIVMGLKFTGEVPFRYVYLHGLVRDETGRKMSKSLGNVLDPLDLIYEYGTDALRFSLLTGGTPGNDMKLTTTRIEANRNFANKIWNAARFVAMNLASAPMDFTDENDPHAVTFTLPAAEKMVLADRWILSRLANLQTTVTRLFDDWQLGEAGRQIYEFLWSEYCDWYIEATKTRLYGGDAEAAQAARQVLAYVLEQSLRLLHPYMPFVTEAIWRHLPGMAEQGESLMTARWVASSAWADAETENAFGRLQEIIRAIRNVRSEYNVEPSRRITAIFSTDGYTDLIEQNIDLLVSQAKLTEDLQVSANIAPPEQAVALAAGGVSVYLPLAGMVDLDAERQRLQKELENVEGQLRRSEKLLENQGFVAKAPAEVVQRERDKITELQSRRQQLQTNLAELAL
jgi:valyl-tRNA synthetase